MGNVHEVRRSSIKEGKLTVKKPLIIGSILHGSRLTENPQLVRVQGIINSGRARWEVAVVGRCARDINSRPCQVANVAFLVESICERCNELAKKKIST